MCRPPMSAIQRPQGGRVGIARVFGAAVVATVHLINPVRHALRRQHRADPGIVPGVITLEMVGKKAGAGRRRVLFSLPARAQEIIVVACQGLMSAGKQRFGQVQGIAAVGARSVKPGTGHGFQNGVVVGLPLRKEGVKGFEVEIRLVADGVAVKGVRVVGRNVPGQPRRIRPGPRFSGGRNKSLSRRLPARS